MPTALVETTGILDRRALVGMALDAQLGRSEEEIAAIYQVTKLFSFLTDPESSLTQAISGHKWKPDAFNRDHVVRQAHEVVTARLEEGLAQLSIHSLEEHPDDISHASQKLISQLRKEQTEKGTVLQAFQKLQQAREPDAFWDLIQHDEEVGIVVRLFSQTLLDITKARYAKAEAMVSTGEPLNIQPALAERTIFHPRNSRKHTSLKAKLALGVAAFSLVLTACGGEVKQSLDKTIMSLPQPTQTSLLSEGGETMINKSTVYRMVQDYCLVTGCDISTLLPQITLADHPDPNNLLYMQTVPGKGMTIFSTSTIFKDAGPYYHELAHLDVQNVELPEYISLQFGLKDKAYSQGFAIDAPELGDNKRALTSLEEAAAEAMMMIVGEKQGVYYQPQMGKKSYGNMGLFLLRLADSKGISDDDFIKLHRESDVFEFMRRLTGKTNDVPGFIALYATVDEMRAAMQQGNLMTVDKAMQEYELFKKEYEQAPQPTPGAFFRLPWNQTDNFALKAWKRIVRGNTDPSMEVALANKYVRQKDQRDNLAATLPRNKTVFRA